MQPELRYKLLSNLYCYNSSIIDILKNCFSKPNKTKGYFALKTKGYSFPSSLAVRKPMNEISSINVDFFLDIINKCKNKGVGLVIAFPPRYEKFNYKESEEFKILLNITNEHNIPFIHELYLAPEFIKDSTLFLDVSHVNDIGAKMFTRMFCEKIRNIKKN